jgi:hypothetical protein
VTQKMIGNTGQSRSILVRDSRAHIGWMLTSLVFLSSAYSIALAQSSSAGYPEAASGGHAFFHGGILLPLVRTMASRIRGYASPAKPFSTQSANRSTMIPKSKVA